MRIRSTAGASSFQIRPTTTPTALSGRKSSCPSTATSHPTKTWAASCLTPRSTSQIEPAGPQNRDDEALVEDATRAIVWGAERPELLITETLAWHDRRATDEGDEGRGGGGQQPPNVPGGNQTNVSILNENTETPDYDLDQKLKPRGSLFVELYNPWSEDGQRPAGLYGRTLITPGRHGADLSEPGVLLNQMSLLPARVTDPTTNQTVVRYSPVWRMSVVRDPINGRMATELISDAADFQKVYIKQLLRTDPDGFGFNSDQHSERLIYFTTGNDVESFQRQRFDKGVRSIMLHASGAKTCQSESQRLGSAGCRSFRKLRVAVRP